MEKLMTKDELIAFEEDIAACFNKALIKAPIHLSHGNEDGMLEVFTQVEKEDWVLCSWRSHYQCLLKGVPAERLKKDILEGRSISLCYEEYKIVSSGIVTGVLPIAVGIALDIKRKGGNNKVFCFVGDMTSETGTAHECIKFSIAQKLPIRFIIEDNDQSVCSPTRETWGLKELTYENVQNEHVTYYKYKAGRYPHAGSGVRIQF